MDSLVPDTNALLSHATQGIALQKASQAHNLAKSTRASMEKIDAVAKDFEAVFISEMMKPMFEGIETDGLMGGGKGEEIFRGMMLQEYGKMVAETGAIGLSSHIKNSMLELQEQASGIDLARPRPVDVKPLHEKNASVPIELREEGGAISLTNNATNHDEPKGVRK